MRRLVAGLVTAGLSVGFTSLQPISAGATTGQTLAKFKSSHASTVKKMHPNWRSNPTFVSRGKSTPRFTPDVGSDAAHPKVNTSSPSLPVINSSTVQLTGPAVGAKGTNSYDQEVSHGAFSYDLEPPDQGFCAGNGWIIDPINNVIKIFSESTFAPQTSALALEDFFGTPYAFDVKGTDDFTIQGDPRCYYDAPTQRWFVTELLVDFTTTRSYIILAASDGSDPTTAGWNIYTLDVTDDNTNGTPDHTAQGCPCLGDQPLLGADANTIDISTNEYSFNNPNVNGAMYYAFDKAALAAGNTANVVIFAPGIDLATPDGSCYTGSTNNLTCWYSIEPAQTPGTTGYASTQGGTEYALSALQFTGTFDNRVAEWALTNTHTISTTPALSLTETTLTSENYGFPFFNGAYLDPPVGFCSGVDWTNCVNNQKAGPTPAGDSINTSQGTTAPEPGPITSNDDRMLQTVYAGGSLYSSLNSVVGINQCECFQTGLAWFKVTPSWTAGPTLNATMAQQGYVGVAGADVFYGALGVTQTGGAVLAFSLTGFNYYPSTAYVVLGGAKGTSTPVVHIADQGKSPQDGFSETQDWGTGAWRPRWGDYSSAVADGSSVYFASEYIQSASCSDAAWNVDSTCGGTRGAFINYGSSINKVTF